MPGFRATGALSVHGQMRGRPGPCGYSQIDGEALWFLHLQAEVVSGLVGILCILHERTPGAVLFPTQLRRNVEVYIYAVRRAEVGAYAVVRGDLRKRSRAAGPLILVIELGGRVIVVRIVKACAVGKNRFGAQDGVVQDALHAVAVRGCLP